MVTDFKVFFYARKNYINKDGKVAILIRLALNGQKTQFSSNLTIAPKMWNEIHKTYSFAFSIKLTLSDNRLPITESHLCYSFTCKTLIMYSPSLN